MRDARRTVARVLARSLAAAGVLAVMLAFGACACLGLWERPSSHTGAPSPHDEAVGADGGDRGVASSTDGASAGREGDGCVTEVGGAPSSNADGGVSPAIRPADGTLVGSTANGMGARVTYRVPGALPDVAEAVLGAYVARGDMTLVHAGYVDLFQRVWSCVLTDDDGRAHVAIVDGRGAEGDDATCLVIVEQMGEGGG